MTDFAGCVEGRVRFGSELVLQRWGVSVVLGVAELLGRTRIVVAAGIGFAV